MIIKDEGEDKTCRMNHTQKRLLVGYRRQIEGVILTGSCKILIGLVEPSIVARRHERFALSPTGGDELPHQKPHDR